MKNLVTWIAVLLAFGGALIARADEVLPILGKEQLREYQKAFRHAVEETRPAETGKAAEAARIYTHEIEKNPAGHDRAVGKAYGHHKEDGDDNGAAQARGTAPGGGPSDSVHGKSDEAHGKGSGHSNGNSNGNGHN